MAWPTVIDAIIDVIERNTSIYAIRWLKVDDYTIRLTLYNGYFSKNGLQYIKDYVSQPNIYTDWEIGTCYVWDYTYSDRKPIYRDSDSTPPKNDSWILTQTVEVNLYFHIEEVGIPQYWDKKIRPVRKTDDPVQTPACAPDTG